MWLPKGRGAEERRIGSLGFADANYLKTKTKKTLVFPKSINKPHEKNQRLEKLKGKNSTIYST